MINAFGVEHTVSKGFRDGYDLGRLVGNVANSPDYESRKINQTALDDYIKANPKKYEKTVRNMSKMRLSNGGLNFGVRRAQKDAYKARKQKLQQDALARKDRLV